MTITTLDPRVSEFETEEAAARYDVWFRAQVQEAIDSACPPIPHDEVVRRMEERLASLQKRQTT